MRRGKGLRSKVIVILVISIMVLGPISGLVLAETPAPMFRNNLARTGRSPESPPVNNTTLWDYETDDPVKSSPVVSERRVYVGTMGGEILCLDAFTGQRVWSYRVQGGVESSPAVWEGKVYVGSDDTYVYCLNASDGSLVWSTETRGEIKSSPAVRDGLVYVGSNDFSVHCFDAHDGDEVWTFATGGYVYSSPALFGDTAYFGSCDGEMYAVNATTGALVWNFTADFCPASPAIYEDLVIFGAYDGLVHYLNRTTGREVHKVPLYFAEIYSSAGLFVWRMLGQPYPWVFIATTDGKMVGIGPWGEELWNISHPAGITSSPVIAKDPNEIYDPILVYGDEGGTLHCIEIYNSWILRSFFYYEPIEWHVKLGSSIQSTPFVWHRKVYVGVETEDGGGRVVCIGAIDNTTEPYVEVLRTSQTEGEVNINFIVHNLLHDRATVEFEGEVKEAFAVPVGPTMPPQTPPPPTYLSNFNATPPEGLEPFTIRLYSGDALVLTHRGEVMNLVEGWDEVVLKVRHPGDGERVTEGILVASGTVSSNYTIQRIYAEWDESGERINCSLDPNWTVALETSELEDGRHSLTFVAYDGFRFDSVTIHVLIGEEETPEVVLAEVGILLILIVVLVVLFRTKPPRVSEKASDQ